MQVGGDKRFVVGKRYPWKIFEQNVTVAYFKNQSLDVFCKKRTLENLANFTGKYLFWSFFFLNLQAWEPEAFLKRDPDTYIFPLKFAKFLRAPILKYNCEPLLLYLQVILFTLHEKDTANKA